MPRKSTKPTFDCQECGVAFQVHPSRVKRGDTIRFCGDTCYRTHRKSHPIPAAERFWKHVRKTPTCWVWTGGAARNGYGVFRDDRSRHVAAHRFSYELHYGPFNLSLSELHRCDNPPCVRPDHLFLGTYADNAQDMKAKDRHTRGERFATVKLNTDQVREIRARYSAGGISQRQLAAEYGVSEGAVQY